jgi:hypothetical protein
MMPRGINYFILHYAFGSTMDGRTRLEMIADEFVESYLRNNPVIVYSLDTFLEDWVTQHREELEANNSLTLDEILRQHLQNTTDYKDKIDIELTNAATSYNYEDEEIVDTTLLEHVKSIDDQLTYQLTQLVLRSSKVRIRTLHELEEAELEDPLMPNKWIYYKDCPLSDVSNYVLRGYEMLNKEDEKEEQEDELK